jgi:hypothetical protein
MEAVVGPGGTTHELLSCIVEKAPALPPDAATVARNEFVGDETTIPFITRPLVTLSPITAYCVTGGKHP